MAEFGKTVSDWVKRQELAMEAVVKEAAQDLAEDVTTPRAKGGRLPVDTGFLRNSIAAAVNSIPSGEPSDVFDMQPTILAINKVKAGDRLVIGFTAEYARAMEFKYFFVRSAAQNWPTHVTNATKRVEKAIG